MSLKVFELDTISVYEEVIPLPVTNFQALSICIGGKKSLSPMIPLLGEY